MHYIVSGENTPWGCLQGCMMHDSPSDGGIWPHVEMGVIVEAIEFGGVRGRLQVA